jgi:protein tyrosine phosphatase (PTP) superfamily phosphohydrolase (DUF442 family)
MKTSQGIWMTGCICAIAVTIGCGQGPAEELGDCGKPVAECALAENGGENGGEPVIIEVTESYEADIGEGWIAAGQPTQARLEDVVGQGARILSLRHASEEAFDEQALVESLGGTFIRYATSGSDYENVAFREAMYDLYDAEHEKGGPVYLHCASSNRVGASWALYNAERKGVAAEDALELGRQAGLGSLESMVMDILGL